MPSSAPLGAVHPPQNAIYPRYRSPCRGKKAAVFADNEATKIRFFLFFNQNSRYTPLEAEDMTWASERAPLATLRRTPPDPLTATGSRHKPRGSNIYSAHTGQYLGHPASSPLPPGKIRQSTRVACLILTRAMLPRRASGFGVCARSRRGGSCACAGSLGLPLHIRRA